MPSSTFCVSNPHNSNILVPIYSEYTLFIYDISNFVDLLGSGNLTKYFLSFNIIVFFFSLPVYSGAISKAFEKSNNCIFSTPFVLYLYLSANSLSTYSRASSILSVSTNIFSFSSSTEYLVYSPLI